MSVKSRVENRIASVELARPEKKNALTAQMYEQLAAALAAADADPKVRAILLHGTQDCFTAGNDVGDFLNRPAGAEPPVAGLFKVLPNLAKPIVAAVGGPAVGIGSTMLLHCDLVYAAGNARFQLPFVPLGIVPAQGKGRIELAATSEQLLSQVEELAVAVTTRSAAASGSLPAGFILRGPCAKFW